VHRLILLSITLALLSTSAGAAKPKVRAAKWVTLVHTGGAVPADWAGALRAAAEGAESARTWMPPPSLSLDELMLTLGCATWDAACAGQVASLLGADNALSVDVIANGAGAALQIASVSRNGTVVGEPARVEVSLDDDGRMVASAFVAGAVRGARPTVLVVTADLPGTEVLIDGEPRGVTPLTLVDIIAPGEHGLLLRREGRAPLNRTITVAAGAITREAGALAQGPPMTSTPSVGEATPEPTLPSPPADGVPPLAFVGFGLGGAGVVAGVVGVGLAAHAFSTLNAVFTTAKDAERTPTTKPDICAGPGDTFQAPGCGDPLSPDEIDDDLFLEGTSEPDPESRINAFRLGLYDTVNVGVVVAAAGLLVGATGLAIGFGALSGEEQDAAPGGGSLPTPASP
jgi:hypothetical protein